MVSASFTVANRWDMSSVSPIPGELVKAPVDLFLRLHIQRRRRFVQHEQLRGQR